MALTKEQKQKILEGLKEKIDRQKSVVFVDFAGLAVKDLAKLRREMKKKDCEFKIAKKTLISLAFKEKKIKIDSKKLEGEIALAFGYKDEISPFRILHDFSGENENLKILGGLVDKEILEKEKAIELSQLPTREELFARLVFAVKEPLSGFYNTLKGNLRNLVYVFSQLKVNK